MFKQRSIIVCTDRDDLTLVIGGSEAGSYASPSHCCGKTFIYHHKESKWLKEKNLIQGRLWHATGIVIDGVTHEKLVVITGGTSYVSLGINFKSTEILFDDSWSTG